MVDAIRAQLDELMGINRNGDREDAIPTVRAHAFLLRRWSCARRWPCVMIRGSSRMSSAQMIRLSDGEMLCSTLGRQR